MTGNDALMRRVRMAAQILRAKADLQRLMPTIQRLQTVGQINRLRHQIRTGRPAITSHNPKT